MGSPTEVKPDKNFRESVLGSPQGHTNRIENESLTLKKNKEKIMGISMNAYDTESL